MAGVTINYKGNSIATMEGQSGTKTLKTSGKYCEDDITVNYIPESGTPSVTSKCFSVTFLEQQTGEVELNPNGDSDIAAHYTDSKFIVGVIRKAETSSTGFLCGISSNNNIRNGQTIYGSWARSTSSGVSWGNMGKSISSASTRTACTFTVSSTGVISVYGSTSVPIPAGEYLVVCSW